MSDRAHPVIRPRRDDEVPRLATLLLEQQPESGYPHRNPLPFPAEQFIRRESEIAAWVAEVDGELAGHVSLCAPRDPATSSPDDAEVVRAWAAGHGAPVERLGVVSVLFTTVAARGAGVGYALLEHAVQEARERGLRPCLDVLPSHERAHALYERAGWRAVGTFRPAWIADGHPDLVAMVRD